MTARLSKAERTKGWTMVSVCQVSFFSYAYFCSYIRDSYRDPQARPDVLSAAHPHSLYGNDMCATGRTLDMLTQDFSEFYKDHVLHKNFAKLVLNSNEGKAV